MTGYLLDTNLVSEFVSLRANPGVMEWLDSTAPEHMYLSVLTLGEIRRGIERLGSGRRKRALLAWLESDLRVQYAGRTLPVTEAIAETWGELTARSEARGVVLPPADGLLAATAFVHDLTIVTRNSRDFAHTGARVLNPWSV